MQILLKAQTSIKILLLALYALRFVELALYFSCLGFMIIFDCITKQYGCLSERREKGMHWLTTAGFTWENKEFHASLRDCKCIRALKIFCQFLRPNGMFQACRNEMYRCDLGYQRTSLKAVLRLELINASNFMGKPFLRLVWHEKFSFVYVEQNHFPCSRSRPQLTVKYQVYILHIYQELSKSPNHNIWLRSKPHHSHIN